MFGEKLLIKIASTLYLIHNENLAIIRMVAPDKRTADTLTETAEEDFKDIWGEMLDEERR